MDAPAPVWACGGGRLDPLEHLGSASAPVDSAKALRAPPRPRRYSFGSLLAGGGHAAVGTGSTGLSRQRVIRRERLGGRPRSGCSKVATGTAIRAPRPQLHTVASSTISPASNWNPHKGPALLGAIGRLHRRVQSIDDAHIDGK